MTMRISPFVMDITGKELEIEMLMEYLDMRRKCLNHLYELSFLSDFPNTDNSPKHVIECMFNRYKDITNLIDRHPSVLIAFKIEYRTEDTQVHQITLSNHMQFRDDILMICFIQHLLFTPKYLNRRCNVMIAMMVLMINKYNVNVYTWDFEPHAITFPKISVSYLSVYLDILNNNFANFYDISQMIPDFDGLPPMIYAPLVISILPILNDPPIAILIAISLVVYEISLPNTAPNISLHAHYNRILSLYNSTIPEQMKLLLCSRYNIVVPSGNSFKFAPVFAKYREKAKLIISEERPYDPHLEAILSII